MLLALLPIAATLGALYEDSRRKLFVVDLFAGGGGAACGLRDAGLEAVHVELDPAACRTLEAAGFEALCMDVRSYVPDQAIALLWASPPCTGISLAGDRLGERDPRSGLTITADFIEKFKPTWVILENVGGALKHKSDCTRDGTHETCAGCDWTRFAARVLRLYPHGSQRVLDAADYGVPQHRRRIFLVAGPVPFEWPEPTHGRSDSEAVREGRLLPWTGMGEVLPMLQGGFVRQEMTGAMARSTEEPSPTVTTKGTLYAHTTDVGRRVSGVSGSVRDASGELLYPRSAGRAGSEPERLLQPAPTVTTTEEKGTRASASSGWTFHGGPDRASDAAFLATGRRRLTTQECAVLMGFPENYPFRGGTEELYRQIGNAVVPKMAEGLAKAVLRTNTI